MRANASAGFSIVTYSGNSTNDATIGHGLGVSPEMIIVKNRTSASSGTAGSHWLTRHKAIGMTGSGTACQLYLNLTGQTYNNDHGTLITNGSTLLQIKAGSGSPNYFHAGETGQDYVAYCFAPVTGYSSFGSFTGNGSADGPFVYTGFRPAFLIIKRTDAINHWYTYDNKREGYNPANEQLTANLSNAEYSSSAYPSHDFLSNGFKLTTTNVGRNASGGTYIYLAFAENPFKTSRAR